MMDILSKIQSVFDFKPKEMLYLIVFTLFGIWQWQTLDTVTQMQDQYYIDIQDNASVVLNTLRKNSCDTPEKIGDFLASKPAGKSDLRKGVMNDKVYDNLYIIYGDLVRSAKILFQ